MKEERRKNLNIVVIIILFMVILGLVGYILLLVDKINLDNKIKKEKELEKTEE